MSLSSTKKANNIKVILLTVFITLVAIIACIYIQYVTAGREYSENIEKELLAVEKNILDTDNKWVNVLESYDKLMQDKADMYAYSMKNIPEYDYFHLSRDASDYDVHNIIIADREGNILARAHNTQADFRKAIFNSLKECFKHNTRMANVEVDYLNGEKYLYYASSIDSERMVILEDKLENLDNLVKEFSSWKNVLKNVSVGNNGTVVAISDKTYTVRYDSDEKYIGKDAINLGVNPEKLKDGYSGWIKFDGNFYYAGVKNLDYAYIVCMVPQREMLSNISRNTFFMMFVLVSTIITMVIYSALLANSSQAGSYTKIKFCPASLYFNKALGRRLVAIIAIGLIILFYIAVYAQTLLAVSKNSIRNEQRIVKIRNYVDDYLGDYAKESNYYDKCFLNKTDIVTKIISNLGSDIDETKLKELVRVVDVNAIDVFDTSGTVIFSSDDNLGYMLSLNEEDESYPYRKYLVSKGSCISEPVLNKNGEYIQYCYATMYSKKEGITGLIRVSQNTAERDNIMAGGSISSILSSVVTENGTECFAIDEANLTFEYSSYSKYIGRYSTDYGIEEDELKDGYNGYIKISNEKYYASITESNGYYIVIATPMSQITKNHTIIALKVSVICFIAMAALFVLLCVRRKKDIEEGSLDGDSVLLYSTAEYQRVADRWKKTHLRWNEQTPEQQLFTFLSEIITLTALIVTISVFIVNRTGNKNSIIVYILAGNWERGFNLFSLTASLMVISVGCVINKIISKILDLLSYSLNARGTTICRMLGSSSKYIIFFIGGFYCLRLYGVNPSTLLASAGVMSIVIGLGANTLMSDILAGIFLIFEGEFRVGDIVTIDDWRGVVLDIGIRTTKIEDDYHNIKIISNSKVSGIINMTKKISYAEIFVSIDYGESLERVESVLRKEFPNIKKNIPRITGELYYTNVHSLGDNGVILRILAECNEIDRPQTIRDLNRELRLIFDRYDINVPYPQITVNQPIEYKKATVKEMEEASAFEEEERRKIDSIGELE